MSPASRCSDEEYIWVNDACYGWFRRGQSQGACISDAGSVQRSRWAYNEAVNGVVSTSPKRTVYVAFTPPGHTAYSLFIFPSTISAWADLHPNIMGAP